ncbi:MAG: CBS domain-containing protein [Bacteroidota bacterium]
MIAGSLYTRNIIPLRTSDTGREALSTMNEFNVSHLPIVNNEQLLGLISEDDIVNNNIDEAVGSYQLSLHKYYVNEQDHIYEVMRLLGEYQLSVIPVVDVENNYLGLIFQDDLLEFFANAASFSEPGAIIVLEMNRRDYSLSEISRIVESENAAVLSAFVTSNLQTGIIDVTIKVNRQEIQSIIATFEAFTL